MAKGETTTRTFPWTDSIEGHAITFRLMTADDKETVLAFARSLPEADLMFLRLDITRPEVVDEWIRNIETNRTLTVLAEEEGRMIGYGSLHHDDKLWTRHMGELRILVAGKWRRLGIGRRLANEAFHIARDMKLDRMIVQMAADQPHVRQLFETMGFRPEALLTDWVMARDGRTHDLLIMSHFVDDFGS